MTTRCVKYKKINVNKNNDSYYPDSTQNNNQADNETIRISNCKGKIENKIGVEIICNSTRVINKPRDDEGIGDTGTIDHFLKEGAPADEKEEATNPIKIEMLNGTIERSTHTCYLRIPGLPKELRKGHIVPGLSHSSLVSIKKSCQGGCEVIFKKNECEVWYKKKQSTHG